MTLGTEKLEWCGYTTVKNVEDMFIRFDRVHERDGRTDRRTDDTARLYRSHLCIASRSKNMLDLNGWRTMPQTVLQI